VADLDTPTLHATQDELMEMGPIDYVVLEWPREQTPSGAAERLIELVDRGVIRILDIAFMAKDDDGRVGALDLGGLDAFGEFAGASSGILDEADLEEAGQVLEPGTAAAVLIWENRWAAPLAVALRRSGAQLVASGRIPVQGIIAAIDAAEAGDRSA
jgi:hypothetical protein